MDELLELVLRFLEEPGAITQETAAMQRTVKWSEDNEAWAHGAAWGGSLLAARSQHWWMDGEWPK